MAKKYSQSSQKTIRKLKRGGFILSMLAVALINFAVFWVYVNFNSILMAFQSVDAFGNVYFTAEQFTRVWRDLTSGTTALGGAVVNSFIYYLAGTLVSLPISVLFAYFLYKKVPGHSFFRIVFFLPSIISAVVMVTLFKYMIYPTGPINTLIEKIFHVDPSSIPVWLGDNRTAKWVIVFYGIFTGFGINIVMFTGTIGRIPEELFEYGKLNGIGMIREFWSVVVPLIWPTMSTMIVFSTAGIFTSMGNILIFTNGNFDTQSIAYFIYSQVKSGSNYYYPSAIGICFTLIGIPLVLGVKYLLGKICEDVEY